MTVSVGLFTEQCATITAGITGGGNACFLGYHEYSSFFCATFTSLKKDISANFSFIVYNKKNKHQPGDD